MILYEYPFNERIRTYLRLEQLFRRLLELMGRESALDHHFALAPMFELVEIASRTDLKSAVMRDLERQKNILDGLRDVGLLPAADVGLLQEAYKAYRSAARRQALQKQPGKVGGDQFAEERRSVMRLWRELGLN